MGNFEPAWLLEQILLQLQQGIATTPGSGNQNVIIVAAIPAGDNNIGNVDVVTLPALPAGTNNIGDVDIASALPAGTNNIGDIDVLSVVPGTAATSLGKAEDAAHASGDTGVMVFGVRTDTPAPLGAAGDYVPPIMDSTNLLWAREGMQPVYEDNTAGKAVVEHRYTAGRATADTLIKTGAGLLHTVNLAPTGVVTGGVLTLYDNTAESGTVLWSGAIPTSIAPATLTFDITFATGLYVGFDATLANVQATCSYR